MISTSKLRVLYLLPLLLLAVLFQTPSTATYAQTMYGPLNLYHDIYWGTDGNVYASSQVVPSIYHYTHQYKANLKVTAPNGAVVTNVSPWSYNSASTSIIYNFAGVYLDGIFTEESDGSGWCGVIAGVFATVVGQARQTQVPAWVRLGTFGNFTAQTGGSYAISISYTFSGNAVNRSFTVSFGMGLSGDLVPGDITVTGSGSITVNSSNPSITATYTPVTQHKGKLKAAVNAYNGLLLTVLAPNYVESAAEQSINGG